MGEKWPKMGKLPFLTHFSISPIFRPFFSHFPGGAKILFSAIFFPFRAGGPKWGLYEATRIANPRWIVPPKVSCCNAKYMQGHRQGKERKIREHRHLEDREERISADLGRPRTALALRVVFPLTEPPGSPPGQKSPKNGDKLQNSPPRSSPRKWGKNYRKITKKMYFRSICCNFSVIFSPFSGAGPGSGIL